MNKILSIFKSLRTTHWLLVVVAFLVVGWFVGSIAGDYIWRTAGGAGKCIAGGLIGFWFSRNTTRLNLSQIPDLHDRCIAALSQSILIAAGMVAVALSV